MTGQKSFDYTFQLYRQRFIIRGITDIDLNGHRQLHPRIQFRVLALLFLTKPVPLFIIHHLQAQNGPLLAAGPVLHDTHNRDFNFFHALTAKVVTGDFHYVFRPFLIAGRFVCYTAYKPPFGWWVLAPLRHAFHNLTQGGFLTAGVRPDHPATFPLLQGSWGRERQGRW